MKAVTHRRKILPPVYLLATMLLSWLAGRYLPVARYLQEPLAYFGVVPVLGGLALAASGALLFRKAETGIIPFQEATTLVTDGLYRRTRNPMYLGMFAMAGGYALLNGTLGALLPLPVFFLVIRNRFVLPEEQFLEAAFGESYLAYKSQVRRWL